MVNERLRRTLLWSVVAAGTVGIFFGYNVGGIADLKRREELQFAYGLHLKTVRDLVAYARARELTPAPADLDEVVARAAAARPAGPDRADFSRFESTQQVVATLARELITMMDGELDPRDEGFARLLRRFETEERGLERIRLRRRRTRAYLPLLAARDERP